VLCASVLVKCFVRFLVKSGLENRAYGHRGSAALIMRHPSNPQKLALTSPTSGGRSVGIVRSRTKTTGLVSKLTTILCSSWCLWLFVCVLSAYTMPWTNEVVEICGKCVWLLNNGTKRTLLGKLGVCLEQVKCNQPWCLSNLTRLDSSLYINWFTSELCLFWCSARFVTRIKTGQFISLKFLAKPKKRSDRKEGTIDAFNGKHLIQWQREKKQEWPNHKWRQWSFSSTSEV
jgi:hypothetical protein